MLKNDIPQLTAHGDISIIQLFGDVTPLSEKPVMELYEKISLSDSKKILLDFTSAGYINSGGIAIIISLVAEARKKEQRVGVTGLTDHFLKVFNMIGLTDYVALFKNENEAREQF